MCKLQFYYKVGKHNYIVGQLGINSKGQEILKSGEVMGQSLLHKGVCITKKLTLLQRGSIFIAKWGRYYRVGQLYCKVGQILQKRPVHLRDTRTNRDPCLLAGQMFFDNKVLYDIMPF